MGLSLGTVSSELRVCETPFPHVYSKENCGVLLGDLCLGGKGSLVMLYVSLQELKGGKAYSKVRGPRSQEPCFSHSRPFPKIPLVRLGIG